MSNNPMIKQDFVDAVVLDDKTMSISGSINKTAILLGVVVLVAYYTWTLCAQGFADKAHLLMIVGAIAALVLAIVTAFKPRVAPITAPVFALCQGASLGVISYLYGSAFDGIIQNAIMITMSTMFAMLFLYKTRIIKATETFRKTIVTATFGVLIFYIAGWIGALLGHPMTIFNGGIVGIGVSLLICGIAAFNFILDFDFIERGEEQGLPQYFEWYGSFSLLVTLLWLYVEVLRLLAQFNSRD